MFNRIMLLVIFLSGSTMSLASGESKQSNTLNSQFESILKKHKLIALAGIGVESNQAHSLAAVGFRTNKKEQTVTLSDKWHIGSITKPMTATLAAVLVKENNIQWNTTIKAIWPDLEMHPGYQSVTLMELLSHQAGITEDITRTTDWASRFHDKRDILLQREEWASEILKQAPVTDKGNFLYSNASYVVAGAMLEKVTKRSWESLIEEKLFKPLRMTQSGFGAPVGDSPWGHHSSFFSTKPINPTSKKMPADNPFAMGPAGTIHVSLNDMAEFIKLHLGHYPDVLSKKELQELHKTSFKEGAYHAGWIHVKRNWAEGPILTHSGSNTFWYASVWLAPETDVGFFAVTNIASRSSHKAVDEAIGVLLRETKNRTETNE